MTLRHIVTTLDSAEVSEEYAEAVTELVQADRQPLRCTEQTDQFGQVNYSVRVHEYSAPDTGEQRWAVDYEDEDAHELKETDSRAEAEAHYEDLVRHTAEHMTVDSDGHVERFAATDVDGVPGPLPEVPQPTVEDITGLLHAEGHVLYLARTGEDGQEDPHGAELGLFVGPVEGGEDERRHEVYTRPEAEEELQDTLYAETADELGDLSRGQQRWLVTLVGAATERRIKDAADQLF